MSRETSPYVVGDFWLEKRRDGASPDVWQATTYRPGSRQIVYRSTKCRSLDDAKGWLHSFVDEQRARRAQPIEEAKLVPALFTYWNEHGKKAERPDAIACSLRIFIGFLMQDEAGVGMTIAQADRALFGRFIQWRLGPHEYEVPWAGKSIKATSKGVKGETIQSDLARVAAALNHQVEYGRIPMAPKVPSVDKRLRSEPRDYRFTIEQMGAIMCVAAYDIGMFRWLMLQLATLVRPEAALRFDPSTQYDAQAGVIDLQPKDKARTKKRNPIIPAIPEIQPMLERWAQDGAKPVKSRKTAWRTIRRVLDLPPQAEAKTFRYTVSTILLNQHRVDPDEVELLLGHRVIKAVSSRYAKFDPSYMAESKAALSKVFQQVMGAAMRWGAVHLLSKIGNEPAKAIDRNSPEAQNLQWVEGGAAYRTRTCDPRITNARKRRQSANPATVMPEQE